MKKTIRALCALALALCLMLTATLPAFAEDKPLLTIACLSDLHNQDVLITGENPKLRGTVSATLTQMAEEEDQVDVVLIGGDVSSDHYTTEAKLDSVLQQVRSYTDLLTKNVLWVTGNHDYNAGEGAEKYDSANYYNKIMKQDVGEVTGDDAYYEMYNGQSVLLGYHYILGGFDFVALNTSPAEMAGSLQNSNYAYTDGQFQWLKSTLERIGTEKTVFFLAHFPIAGSNSMNNGKGQITQSSEAMLSVLKGYPNLIYLYGHDHSGDSAYIKEDTAQRVTVYNTDGAVIGGGVEAEKVDTELSDALVWKFAASGSGYTLQNLATGKYLGVASNLNTVNDPVVWIPAVSGNGFTFLKEGGESIHYSTSSLTFSHGSASVVELYEKVTDGEKVKYVKRTAIQDGGEYVLVSNGNRALTNKIAPTNSQRMAAMDVLVQTVAGETVLENAPVAPGVPEVPTAPESFISSFMGSMRYYNNSIDGYVGPNDSQVVQALMIYVYADRIVLQMKNYGTGNGGSEELKPYVIERKVVYNDMPAPEQPGDVDLSGNVDVADIMKLKALIMADKWSDEELAIGDMDESKKLDVGDIMAIKNIIMSA